MCSLVDLQVFRSCKNLPTSRERAGKWFFSRMHSYVIDQFIFRFKGFALSWALFPEADVIALLWSPYVLSGDVGDQLVHCAESFITTLLRVAKLLLVYPLANQLLFNTLLTHVTEEGTGGVMGWHVHPHVHGAILIVKLGCRIGVGPGAGYLVILIRSPENFTR